MCQAKPARMKCKHYCRILPCAIIFPALVKDDFDMPIQDLHEFIDLLEKPTPLEASC